MFSSRAGQALPSSSSGGLASSSSETLSSRCAASSTDAPAASCPCRAAALRACVRRAGKHQSSLSRAGGCFIPRRRKASCLCPPGPHPHTAILIPALPPLVCLRPYRWRTRAPLYGADRLRRARRSCRRALVCLRPPPGRRPLGFCAHPVRPPRRFGVGLLSSSLQRSSSADSGRPSPSPSVVPGPPTVSRASSFQRFVAAGRSPPRAPLDGSRPRRIGRSPWRLLPSPSSGLGSSSPLGSALSARSSSSCCAGALTRRRLAPRGERLTGVTRAAVRGRRTACSALTGF